MRGKRILLSSILITIIFLTVFLIYDSISTVSTISDITISEKGYSDVNKEAWIKGFNPNAPLEYQEEIKVIVKEPMVWNLIQKDKTYFVNYIKKEKA